MQLPDKENRTANHIDPIQRQVDSVSAPGGVSTRRLNKRYMERAAKDPNL
jgi:hypothetical protein